MRSFAACQISSSKTMHRDSTMPARAVESPNRKIAQLFGSTPLWSVEREQLRLEIGAFRQKRMNRMIGGGAGAEKNSGVARGIVEAAAHRIGEIVDADIVRARRDEQEAAGRDARGGEARELAIAAQARAQILARFHEGGRVGDHDIELFGPGIFQL